MRHSKRVRRATTRSSSRASNSFVRLQVGRPRKTGPAAVVEKEESALVDTRRWGNDVYSPDSNAVYFSIR